MSSIELSPGKSREGRFLIFGFLHGVRSEFSDEISEAAVGPFFTAHELQRLPKRRRKIHLAHRAKPQKPKINQYPFHGESFKSRLRRSVTKCLPTQCQE